jgi:inorganic pyrophosphatase
MKHFTQKTQKMFLNSNGKQGLEYRLHLHRDPEFLKKASFWHDINYINNEDNSFNMIIEVPRGETAKMEMSKESFNPIKQDTKKNKITKEEYLRYYKMTPTFNYGFLPQTWENNKVKYFDNYYGDNDPLDLIEISTHKRYHIGQIVRVYPIGSFCLIDQNEVDWKIIVVNTSELSRENSNNYLIQENVLHRIREIQQWFKLYKIYEGKIENTIYDNDKIYNKEETLKVILENHNHYKDLLNFNI